MSTKSIQKEIEQWEGNVKTLEADLEQAEAKYHKAEEKRSPLVLYARLNDSKAKAKLEKLDEEWILITREVSDCKLALTQARDKLQSLRADLQIAQQRELEVKMRKSAKAIKERFPALEGHMDGLIAELEEVKAEALKMGSMATDLEATGRSPWSVMQRVIGDWLAWSLWNFNFSTINRPSNHTFDGRLSEMAAANLFGRFDTEEKDFAELKQVAVTCKALKTINGDREIKPGETFTVKYGRARQFQRQGMAEIIEEVTDGK